MRDIFFRSASFAFSSRDPLHPPLPFVAIPLSGLTPNLFSYVLGINNESSFESTLLRRAPSCEVWGYDYSVNNVRFSPPSTGFNVLG